MKIHQLLGYYKNQSIGLRLYIVIRMILVDIRRIINFFPEKAQSITELACGYGVASFVMADKYKDTPICSYDIDQARIQVLNTMNPYPHLKFHHDNVLNIQTFDSKVILMMDLLHHLTYDEQIRLLTRIREASPDDLVLIVKDMDKGRYSFRQLCNYCIDIVHTKQFRFYYRTKASFIQLFEQCGFSVKKAEPVNRAFVPLNHVLFVLEK